MSTRTIHSKYVVETRSGNNTPTPVPSTECASPATSVISSRSPPQLSNHSRHSKFSTTKIRQKEDHKIRTVISTSHEKYY